MKHIHFCLPVVALLSACGSSTLEEGFEEDLTKVCAVTYGGASGDINFHADTRDATISMLVTLPGAMQEASVEEPLSRDYDFASGEATLGVKVGENLREPCSDVAMNEEVDGQWNATAGTASLDLAADGPDEPFMATLVLEDVQLDPEDDGDRVHMDEFVFDDVEVWEL